MCDSMSRGISFTLNYVCVSYRLFFFSVFKWGWGGIGIYVCGSMSKGRWSESMCDS